MQKALVTGIIGRDSSYLARLLLSKGNKVHGIIRQTSTFNTDRIDEIYQDPHEPGDQLILHCGDLAGATSLGGILERIAPTEICNLGAQSQVRVSFDQPEHTADTVATGTLRLLEAVRDYCAISGLEVRFYQAGSSKMFGSEPPPWSERTPFHPRSPYAARKVAAHWYAVNYPDANNSFICNGILFNHELPESGGTFMTRKITRAATRIKHGLQKKLFLGNLDARLELCRELPAGDVVDASTA
jgi:GDPmannose 4,6-dehydratase